MTSRIGDRPAIDQSVPGAGLLIAVHETMDSPLTYDDPDLFPLFVEMEGLDGHAGTPCRARPARDRLHGDLLALGEGARRAGWKGRRRSRARPAGRDHGGGRPLCRAAAPRRSRFSPPPTAAPMADALVNVFTKPEFRAGAGRGGGAAQAAHGRDGPRGAAAGTGSALPLANVVDMREAPPLLEATTGAVWESRWGSTTFSTGE